MSKTPNGFEITDFLEGLTRVGEKDPAYDAFVRRYSAHRAIEIKREEAGLTKEVLMQNRRNLVKGIATTLLVIAWLAFAGVIFLAIGKPVLDAKAFQMSSIISSMTTVRIHILSAVAVAFLCFAGHFLHAPSRIFTNVAGAIWCTLVTFIRFLHSGPFMTEDNVAWRTLGVLLVTFIFAIVLGTKLGDWLNDKLCNIDSDYRYLKPEKYKFEIFEAVWLVAMIVTSGICLIFFMSMPLFFKAALTWPFRILSWICPLVFFVLFCIRSSRNMDGDSVNAWVCSSLVTFDACAILELFTMQNITRAMIIWAVLLVVSIGVMITVGKILDSDMSVLMIFMMILTFLVSAVVVVYSTEAGIDSINISAHWWMVAPAFVTAGGAVASTILEMLQHKLL